jgi:hypothetical protein
MTQQEFEVALKFLNVKKYDDEYRLKGFLISFFKSPISSYVLIKGKIPYSMAEILYSKLSKNNIEFLRPYEDDQHPTTKKYIKKVEIHSIDELRFAVDTIREQPFINEWAIGNY